MATAVGSVDDHDRQHGARGVSARMPELPEVETVRRGLAQAVTGAEVLDVRVLDSRALTRYAPGRDAFVHALTGATMLEPRRRGKFLWMPLAGRDEALIGHLGMSGQLLLQPGGGDAVEPMRHERIRIRLRGVDGHETDLVFADQRTFGSLAIDALEESTDVPGDARPSQIGHIGRDPLDAHFDEHQALARIRASRSPIKSVLLNQSIISGIGNIYADEALWRARLNPLQPASTISTRKGRELIREVRAVFEQALAGGGTSFDELYVNVNGESGRYSTSLNAYGQQGKPCARCGRLIVRSAFQNRGSHYCPRCQRLRPGRLVA